MKLLPSFLALLLTGLLASCGGSETADTGKPNFLDTAFVDNPRVYRKHLDSIRIHENLPKKDHSRLRDFIGKYRKSIPAGWTYGRIWESRENMQKMLSSTIEMNVQNLWSRTVKKVVEFRYILGFKNVLDVAVSRFRGRVNMYTDEGKLVNKSPVFAVSQNLAPGDTIGGLRLEYAYYKPTGNELNDPDLDAFRDTLKWMKSIAGTDTASNFKFELKDVLLENGMTIENYWLTDEKDRKAPEEKAKTLGLLKWAEKHADLLKKVKKPLSGYYIEVTPVLTDHVEDSHGQWLIFDRRRKVVRFFTTQKKIAGKKINPRVKYSQLLKADIIDFWNWPMEIRVFKQ